MDISKALTISKNLKNHFRVFEELDEFMREAVALQNVVNDFESQKGAIEDEIQALKEEKAEMEETIASTQSTLEETKKAQQTLDGLRAEIAEIKSKLS